MSNWTSLRITEETRQRLMAYRIRLERDVHRCPSKYPTLAGMAFVSMAVALDYLLTQQAAHGRRAVQSRDRRTGKILILPAQPDLPGSDCGIYHPDLTGGEQGSDTLPFCSKDATYPATEGDTPGSPGE